MSSSALLSSLVVLCTSKEGYSYESQLRDERTQAAIGMLRHLHARGDISFDAPLDETGAEFLSSFKLVLPSPELIDACVALGGPAQLARPGQDIQATAFVALVQAAMHSSNDQVLSTLIRNLPTEHPVLGAWDTPGDTFGAGLTQKLLQHQHSLDESLRALSVHGVTLHGFRQGVRCARFLHRPASWAVALEQEVNLDETGCDKMYPERPLWEVLALDHSGLYAAIEEWKPTRDPSTQARITQQLDVARFFSKMHAHSDVDSIVQYVMNQGLWTERDAHGRTALMQAVIQVPAAVKVFETRKKIPQNAWEGTDRWGRGFWFYAVLGMDNATSATLKSSKSTSNRSTYLDAVASKVPVSQTADTEGRGLLWQLARHSRHKNSGQGLMASYGDLLVRHMTVQGLWSDKEQRGDIDHWVKLVTTSLADGKGAWFHDLAKLLEHEGARAQQWFLDNTPAGGRLSALFRLMQAAFPEKKDAYAYTSYSRQGGGTWQAPWKLDSTKPVDWADFTLELWEGVQTRRTQVQEENRKSSYGQAAKADSVVDPTWVEFAAQMELQAMRFTLPVNAAVPSRLRI